MIPEWRTSTDSTKMSKSKARNRVKKSTRRFVYAIVLYTRLMGHELHGRWCKSASTNSRSIHAGNPTRMCPAFLLPLTPPMSQRMVHTSPHWLPRDFVMRVRLSCSGRRLGTGLNDGIRENSTRECLRLMCNTGELDLR